MEIRDKFVEAGTPYDDIDPEMIEILDILNFQLNIKTKFCCYGHEIFERTYIMFDESESDENVARLLKAMDNNLGTSGVSGTVLYKWARTTYEPYYKMPHRLVMSWMLQIDYVSEELRQDRLNKVTKAIKKLLRQ